jgi:hypothetical protein
VGMTLYEFRDLDLLARVADEANDEGLVSARDIASALGFAEEDGSKHVSTRFAWMRRYGMLEWDEHSRMWRLSRGGTRVLSAHEQAANSAATAVDRVPESKLIDTMAHVVGRYQHGDPMIAAMLRREFYYGTGIGRPKR